MRKVYRIEYVPNVVLLYKRAYKLSYFYCATVGFGLESANVVGYQANAVPNGYSMITPCFVNVDGTDYNIDNFLLNGVEDTMATVQVVNEDGSWGTMGFWFNEYKPDNLPAGWFTDMTGMTPANISLKPGQAVFFNAKATGASAQSAGQVPGIITMDLPNGYSMIGNASSVPVAIDDIKLIGVDDTMATVQVVNPDGSWGTMGFWFNEYVPDNLPSGWFTDMTGMTPANITLEPGQAVFFNTKATGAKAVIPSALAQ
jgi:hypothetical protein